MALAVARASDQAEQEWLRFRLGYLIEITADIMGFKDENGEPLVEKILDTAGQKGTGKWTGINALDLGIPLTLISEAVFARCVSSFKEQRVAASKLFGHSVSQIEGDRAEWLEALRPEFFRRKRSHLRRPPKLDTCRAGSPSSTPK